MPAKKGGKKKKRGKSFTIEKKELVFAQDGQEYAEIIKLLGNGRMEVLCMNINETKIGKICGNMRKRVWCAVGDLVLLNVREYQPDRGDICYKYTEDEARNLKAYGEVVDVKKKVDDEIDPIISEDDEIIFENE